MGRYRTKAQFLREINNLTLSQAKAYYAALHSKRSRPYFERILKYVEPNVTITWLSTILKKRIEELKRKSSKR